MGAEAIMLAILNDIAYSSISDIAYGVVLTELPISVMSSRMGRPILNVTPTVVRLTEPTRQRIVAVAGPRRMAEFIRAAIEEKLLRCERKAAKQRGKAGEG